jgi:HEAT repeat protein
MATSASSDSRAVAPIRSVAPTRVAAPALEIQDIALKTIEPSDAERQAKSDYVQTRIAELNDLAMTDDPASLQQILRELDNPEPSIRTAAVEAAVQFKSPDAIPALKDAEDQATNLDEKVTIQKAIDFLSLSLPANGTNSNP